MSFALSRGNIDSASEERDAVDARSTLVGPSVLFLLGPRAKLAVVETGGGVRLWRAPSPTKKWVAENVDSKRIWFFGRNEEGKALVAASLTGNEVDRISGPCAPNSAKEGGVTSADSERCWRDVVEVGAALDSDEESLVATQAAALARWHGQANFCVRCGAPLEPSGAGWTRTCAACGHVEFPRIDPAVIVAVHDHLGRLLLVHNTAWEEDRMSLLAGYVDAGETPERAVVREVKEEANLNVANVAYLGAQPWPRPRSLMLAYAALVECSDGRPAVDGQPCVEPRPDQIEVDRTQFFTRDELRRDLASGKVRVPGPTSVAHVVIDGWLREDGAAGLGEEKRTEI